MLNYVDQKLLGIRSFRSFSMHPAKVKNYFDNDSSVFQIIVILRWT